MRTVPPHLPLRLAEASLEDFAQRDEAVGRLFARAPAGGIALHHFTVQSSRFEGGVWRGCDLRDVRFFDVELRGCDLSTVSLAGCGFVRVRFQGCKLVGADLSRARFEQVCFEDCVASWANLSESRLRGVAWSGCDLKGAAFEQCAFERVNFDRCDLSEAEFFRTLLRGIDLRSCRTDALRVTLPASGELRGARVTPLQAIGLARLLGLEIEE